MDKTLHLKGVDFWNKKRPGNNKPSSQELTDIDGAV